MNYFSVVLLPLFSIVVIHLYMKHFHAGVAKSTGEIKEGRFSNKNYWWILLPEAQPRALDWIGNSYRFWLFPRNDY